MNIYPLKNDLLIRALRGERVNRPPVWIMRQAGRYLPAYRTLKQRFSFFERCQNPELAAEITIMPVKEIGVDAAILFSDILVVPLAMGMEVLIEEGKGPILPNPIRNNTDLNGLVIPDVVDRLHYTFEAIRLIKLRLEGKVPLIGFAGSPWTIFCYMVQGRGTKSFDEARGFCFLKPKLAHGLLEKITQTTISFLKHQVNSGVDCIQLFDSWGGLLSPEDFEEFSQPYLQRIISELKELAPVILFPKGAWFALNSLSKTGISALGLDWNISPKIARNFVGSEITLQGNLDPARLLGSIPDIRKSVRKMIKEFGVEKYIANLGHGMLPNIPVDNAKAFVEEVKNYSCL